MNKNSVFLFFIGIILIFSVSGCGISDISQSSPTAVAASKSIWPVPYPEESLYFNPYKKKISPDAAAGIIKNLQLNFVEWHAGIPITSLDVDRYGLRAKYEWTETTTTTRYVPSYGGFFVGWNYVPTYSGSYQNSSSSRLKSDMLIISFDEIKSLSLYYMPLLDREFKYGLIITTTGKKITIRVSDKTSLYKLADAIASLAIDRGAKLKKLVGVWVKPLTPWQSQESNISYGLLVSGTGIDKDSPPEIAGVKFGDILIECNGVALKTTYDLSNAFNFNKGSNTLKLMRLETVTVSLQDKSGNTQQVEKNKWVEKTIRIDSRYYHNGQ